MNFSIRLANLTSRSSGVNALLLYYPQDPSFVAGSTSQTSIDDPCRISDPGSMAIRSTGVRIRSAGLPIGNHCVLLHG